MKVDSKKIKSLPQSVIDEVMTWRIPNEEKEVLLVDLDDYFRAQVEELNQCWIWQKREYFLAELIKNMYNWINKISPR